MKIANLEFPDKPLFLAPMEDVTDPAFRLLCKRFGVDMVYTEFVSSEALIRSVNRTQQKLTIYEEERPVVIQIYGHDPRSMAEAARIAAEAKPDIIDINFGCPVKKVAGKGAGAGLLRDIPRMLEITSEVVKAVNIPVTAKTRLGWDDDSKIIVSLAEQLQDCGIAALAIHGRTRAQMYKGDADWTLIGEVKNNQRMHIPIIGNGDVTTPKRALECFERYGVDAVMVGRAAIGHPWIFDEITTTVVLYVESVKDGHRFFEAAKRVGKKKPVIVLKGGRTEAGAQAAASHTGAMASNVKVFDAACRQAGAVLVDKTMELLDLSAVFSSLPLPKGNKVGIMTLGGGWGVVSADLCIENGLEVPKLSQEIIEKINTILPPFWSHANPVDIVAENNPDVHRAIIEELLKWNDCDAVIHMGILGRRVMVKHMLESAIAVDKSYGQKFMDAALEMLSAFEKQFIEKSVTLMEKYEKPINGACFWSGFKG